MSEDTHKKSLGFSTSIVDDGVDVSIDIKYEGDSFSFQSIVAGDGLDLSDIAGKRLNGLNVVLPEGSSIPVGEISGSIEKSGETKQNRKFTFFGKINQIMVPVPMLMDINIDYAYFFYQYTSIAPAHNETPDYRGQTISIGCHITVQEGALASALQDASLTAAYFISDNATITYLDFAGTIHIDALLQALFGVPFPTLTIDIESAGLFSLVKKNGSNTPGQANSTTTSIPGLTYTDALEQLRELQQSSPPPDGETGEYLPPSFPLANMPPDFANQFAEAFSSDDVTGISFWAKMDFSQIELFNSMVTIGYQDQINNLTVYGYRTQHIAQPETAPPTSATLFASIPPFQLLQLFCFSGNEGRENILFRYTSDANQYELSGSLGFSPFANEENDPCVNPSFLFDGNLFVNDFQLTAALALSTGSPTSSVDAPFGMTGIHFAQLRLLIDHTFGQTGSSPVPVHTDLIIQGEVDLSFQQVHLVLNGSIIFENSVPRLVLVSLTADPPLTLYHFAKEVIGSEWTWADDTTRALGFISGSMYYLQCPEDSSIPCVDYTFQYDGSPYQSGYHIEAVLQFFEEHNFQIRLAVRSAGIQLSGTYIGVSGSPSGTLSFYFIELTAPRLTIDTTVNPAKFEIEVNDLKLFGTSIGRVKMGYSGGVFSGRYARLALPAITIDWQWKNGDFSITGIEGLGASRIEAIEEFVNQLNNLGTSGGCKEIVSSMFNNAVETNFSLSLNPHEKPEQVNESSMRVSLIITVQLKIADEIIFTPSLDFSMEMTIPTSLQNLPVAIWATLRNPANLNQIFRAITQNERTYEEIAVVALKKLSISIATSLICRLLTKALARLLLNVIIKGGIWALGPLLELLQYILGTLLASLALALVRFLENIWNEIKDFFTGGNDEEKERAEREVNKIIEETTELLNDITRQLEDVISKIQIQHLKVRIDETGNFVASSDFPNTSELGENILLLYKFQFLKGSIGNENQVPESRLPNNDFQIMTSSKYVTPWSSLLEMAPSYQMNASIQTKITGYTFLTDEDRDTLQSVVSQLNTVKGDVSSETAGNIEQFSQRTSQFIHTMDGYDENGLTSDIVYAQLEDNQLRIGQSALGINSYI